MFSAACGLPTSAAAVRAIMLTTVRAPKTNDPFHAPPEFLCPERGERCVMLPAAGPVKTTTLHAFVRAMAEQGEPLQAARLGYDRVYALDCIARAHACADDALRALAMELFAAFERR